MAKRYKILYIKGFCRTYNMLQTRNQFDDRTLLRFDKFLFLSFWLKSCPTEPHKVANVLKREEYSYERKLNFRKMSQNCFVLSCTCGLLLLILKPQISRLRSSSLHLNNHYLISTIMININNTLVKV